MEKWKHGRSWQIPGSVVAGKKWNRLPAYSWMTKVRFLSGLPFSFKESLQFYDSERVVNCKIENKDSSFMAGR